MYYREKQIKELFFIRVQFTFVLTQTLKLIMIPQGKGCYNPNLSLTKLKPRGLRGQISGSS